MKRIFVQIASYRDPLLLTTIKDMIDNSKYPDNLRIGIARQFNPLDKFDDTSIYENDSRFRILNIPHEESKGACWARNKIQQLYDNEEYTLQIDSHMRFEKYWDEILIEMLEDLKNKGYEKPLLTGYVPSFDSETYPLNRVNEPWRMVFDRFTPEGVVFFLPETIPGWRNLTEPIRSRFYSAHFCFTLGQFAKEVQHDPEFYFHGEEISIGVRAYTHGYDLFHPHKCIIWHEYTRKNRTKHWDDDKDWGKKNTSCHLRNRQLLGVDNEDSKDIDFGIYGFGNVRTLRDYEKYSGLLFSKRAIQDYTLKSKYPPNPMIENEEEWLNSFCKLFKHCIDISPKDVQETDYDFWCVCFEDENNVELYRKDAKEDEIKIIQQSQKQTYNIWREFVTPKNPKKWVVWPHSISKGWCEKIVGHL